MRLGLKRSTAAECGALAARNSALKITQRQPKDPKRRLRLQAMGRRLSLADVISALPRAGHDSGSGRPRHRRMLLSTWRYRPSGCASCGAEAEGPAMGNLPQTVQAGSSSGIRNAAAASNHFKDRNIGCYIPWCAMRGTGCAWTPSWEGWGHWFKEPSDQATEYIRPWDLKGQSLKSYIVAYAIANYRLIIIAKTIPAH